MGALKEVRGMLKTLGRVPKMKPPALDAYQSLGLMVEENAYNHPNALMVIFEDQSVTWGEFNAMANRFAHWLNEQGINRGDVVSVLMDNRIENMAAVTAICKLGAVAGMINTNLTEQPLIHCIDSVEAKAIIFGTELASSLKEVKDQLNIDKQRYLIAVADQPGDKIPKWANHFDPNDMSLSSNNLDVTKKIQLKDLAYYIFTSGTTGLPKASIITHDRHYRAAAAFSIVALDMQPTDRIYICLPLYHSSAMFIGFGAITVAGASMFLRRKFSASQFLDEVREHQTNCFAYIGELCRYLLHQTQRPDDADNPIEKCVGNGLRPDIWMQFKNRFGIEKVIEFYGASEGNAGCVNAFNKDMTVGFCATKHAVVQYDVLEDEIIRNSKGICEKAKKGEPGLFVIEISKNAKFDGYANKEASQKKIIRDVCRPGDRYFNTGDLLKQVDVGFAFGLPHYQFVDRVGDTYRWKGENVSTNEVGELINDCNEVQYCNVYGVEVPATDGRAGMVAIIGEASEIDIRKLSKHIMNKVPSYARPLFIRCLDDAMDTTGTFKMKKGELKEEAFHLNKCNDRILVLKPGKQVYEDLDETFYQQIMQGEAGF